MEIRQLRYLVAVVEEAGFTRAAERLHVAQPGVSAQIRQLERELGQPLLDRSGRTVRPTEAGEALLPYARAALAAVDGMRQTADEFTGLLRGRVTVGLFSAAATHDLDVVSVLAGFHEDHPHVEITLTEDVSDRMVTALQHGELDVAVIGLTGEEPPPGVDLRIVVDEPLVAAVPPGDPLAGRASVALAALGERTLISLPRGTGLRAVLDRACAAAGIRPRVGYEAAAPHVLAELAARGLGVAVLPAGSAAEAGDRLRALEIVRPRLRGRIALAWRTDGPSGPAARAFLARMREAMPAPAPAGRVAGVGRATGTGIAG
ncbi:LysR family transcriptional regulator [Streptomyces sp. enrichment culture]|jgi:DNA-binding transcriptional LysR family regulator|uniref:LysR family transcriptional regulator n=1 Tax=Streptomyces sp. enrichment culture TaxID=1795815 RepID=UPI003F560833